MKRSHIAIFNIAAPTMMNPTFSTVATLVRRGYRVTYVTSERYASEISRLGADMLAIEYGQDALDLASRTLPLAATIFEQDVPSLMLYGHGAVAGLILAERYGVPAIRITPHLAFDEENISRLTMPPELRQCYHDERKSVRDYLQQYGVYQNDANFGRDVPTIYLYIRDLQLGRQRNDNHSLYAGRCSAERSYCVSWRSKRDDRPAALISSSMTYVQGHDYYRMCVAALSKLGWHAVLALGRNIDASSFDSLPHCEIVQDIPLIAVMPQVDLMICQGGMATTMESLYCGTPQVILTQGHPELELYGENVEHHGLGLHLKMTEMTVDNIKRCVQSAHGTSVRDRVRRMQRIVKRSPGGEAVVNWIEEYLESRQWGADVELG